MRNYLLIILIWISAFVGAQVNLNINIVYPAPIYLSDWAYAKSGVATLVLNQREGQLMKVKFQTTLQTTDGTTIAISNRANAAIYTIRSGANVFSLDKLLQVENLQFTNGIVMNSIRNSGKLPSGNYQLCLQLLGSADGSVGEIEMLKVPICRPFTQANFQLPYLLSPQDKTWIDAKIAQSIITFRWSSIIPRPAEHVTYRLQVFEVKENQRPMQALRSNMPILNVDLLTTQYIWRPQLNMNDEAGSVFVWTVQTLDMKGNPMSTTDGLNQGWSEPHVFGVCKKTPKEANVERCGNGRVLD